jgi:iron(III) transport system substrate-binding protein
LCGAVMEHLGPRTTEAWLTGVVADTARPPKGADTDQIEAVARGECQIGLPNTYDLARLMRSDTPDDRAVVEKISVGYPNQKSCGAHVNIAGAAVAKNASNRPAAIRFVEYLASDAAHTHFCGWQ